jgi:hypothetical protein
MIFVGLLTNNYNCSNSLVWRGSICTVLTIVTISAEAHTYRNIQK